MHGWDRFKGAIQIIDIYHAREHYWNVAKKIFSGDKNTIKTWIDKRRKELDPDDVEKVGRFLGISGISIKIIPTHKFVSHP